MNNCSIPGYNAMYYIMAQSVKEGVTNSIPFKSVITTINQVAHSLFTKTILVKSGGCFLVDESNIQQIADLYIEHRVKVPEGADFLKERIRNRFLQDLKLSQQIIKELNEQYGTKVELCVCLKKGPNLGAVRFAAAGVGKESIILYSPIRRIIDEVPEAKDLQEVEKEDLQFWNTITPRRRHVLAHEFSHIRHHDPLSKAAIRVVACVAAIVMWLPAMSLSYGIVSTFYTFSRCFIVQSSFSLLRIFWSRAMEMRADKESMDCLGSNDGAVALLSILEKMGGGERDIDHPSPSIRLEAAKKWKKDPTVMHCCI